MITWPLFSSLSTFLYWSLKCNHLFLCVFFAHGWYTSAVKRKKRASESPPLLPLLLHWSLHKLLALCVAVVGTSGAGGSEWSNITPAIMTTLLKLFNTVTFPASSIFLSLARNTISSYSSKYVRNPLRKFIHRVAFEIMSGCCPDAREIRFSRSTLLLVANDKKFAGQISSP